MIGKIYKIVSPSTCRFFIGSTSSTIENCFQQHLKCYSDYLQYPYHFPILNSFEILKYNNARIELIVAQTIKTSHQLHALEYEYVKKMDVNCIHNWNFIVPSQI